MFYFLNEVFRVDCNVVNDGTPSGNDIKIIDALYLHLKYQLQVVLFLP